MNTAVQICFMICATIIILAIIGGIQRGNRH